MKIAQKALLLRHQDKTKRNKHNNNENEESSFRALSADGQQRFCTKWSHHGMEFMEHLRSEHQRGAHQAPG